MDLGIDYSRLNLGILPETQKDLEQRYLYLKLLSQPTAASHPHIIIVLYCCGIDAMPSCLEVMLYMLRELEPAINACHQDVP